MYLNFWIMIEEALAKVLKELFESEEYKSCFLVEIECKPNNKVEVYIDSDEALTLGICQKISRHLEGFIDEKGWLGEKYTLEVSSPGVDRPLKYLRQYLKNVGRRLSVDTTEETKVEGKLEEVKEDRIILNEKDKKIEILIENIHKAQVIVSFK